MTWGHLRIFLRLLLVLYVFHSQGVALGIAILWLFLECELAGAERIIIYDKMGELEKIMKNHVDKILSIMQGGN